MLSHENYFFLLCSHMMLQLLQKQVNNSIMLCEDMGCNCIINELNITPFLVN